MNGDLDVLGHRGMRKELSALAEIRDKSVRTRVSQRRPMILMTRFTRRGDVALLADCAGR
jgi:hypothetical protein